MVLKSEVVDAFAALGITPDVDQATATKTYKKLALIHHPDRNHGDATATQRFQQIGAAWNICQRHFDNPSWSHIPEPSSNGAKHPQGFTFHFTADDDIPLDEDELYEFYKFMFKETMHDRYSRSNGQRYRHQRSGGAGAGLFSFSGGFAESQERQARNSERQRKEQEEYEKRKRELEQEIEEDERERERLAKKLKADEDHRITALECAFQAAASGNSAGVQKHILDYDLDVNAPRKRVKQVAKQDGAFLHDTLLHVAASHCDETLVMFLIERGANPKSLNREQLTPFHAAIKAGNVPVVRFIMEHRGRSFEGYHPSKAAQSGRTPLQLAIDSGVPTMVELLVKHATTHDVERCWKSEQTSEDIKQVLQSKRGFLPPDDIVHQSTATLSKRISRQKELVDQKQARIAEELERATTNRQKKEERAARRAERDREQLAVEVAQEAERQKKDIEERQRLEDRRRAQEEELRAKELQDVRLRSETRARAEADSRAKAKAESLAKTQAESRATAKAESCVKTEAKSRVRAQEKSLREEKEAQTRLAQEPSYEEAKQSNTALSTKLAVKLSPSSNIGGKTPRTSKMLSEEERLELRRAKLKEKRKAKKDKLLLEKQVIEAVTITEQTTTASQNVGPSSPSKFHSKKPKHMNPVAEDTEVIDEHQTESRQQMILRRRAEQSARDKERHRRTLEERAKANTQKVVAELTEYIPLTPISTHTTRENSPEKAKAPPYERESLSSRQYDIMNAFSSHLAAEEDIQTCIVPDDLFRDERPIGPPGYADPGRAVNLSAASGPDSTKVRTSERTTTGPSERPYRYPYRRGHDSK